MTCYDPDGPTGSGFWHWLVVDIPASVTELAGRRGQRGRPGPARKARSACATTTARRTSAALRSRPGDPPHRYVFTVHAVDTEKLGIDSDATPAITGFNLRFHTIARGMIIPVFGH